MIPWLEGDAPFPALERALRRPNGLLCAGGDLSPRRLLDAYRRGIFPWFSDGEPILWWSPDPRMVLLPREVRISRSLARTLRQGRYRVTLDAAFAEVIRRCSLPRPGQDGSWITPQMEQAYARLHDLGHAHSVETWIDGQLAGGLYGVAIGRAFYGESMFARVSDASKIALAHLSRYLEQRDFAVIDCQMKTAHLASLGAREIGREELAAGLAVWTIEGDGPGRWPMDAAAPLFAADAA
ncbi:MAG TPA: leucyl/phenylalanyl-tRNA--protein transferase [Candidatus Desulfobacillus sp.]|nr:leucyl/phenylalanyl-tRNA--protein transferase [Candidatus Desulfobacillus sp.]